MRVRGFFKPRLSAFGEKYSPLQWYLNARAEMLVLSFPKTGRTWLRLMLHSVLAEHLRMEVKDPLEFHEYTRVNRGVPRIRVFHDDEPHWKHPHQLSASKSRFRDKRVILVVRDPRDTIVSLYFQNTRRWRVFDKDMRDFFWQSQGSLDSMIRYYNIWADNRDVPSGLLLMRYEDITARPRQELRRAVDFLGLAAVADATIAAAVETNEIERMRQRESAGVFAHKRLRPGDSADPESFKARRGKVGGFRDYLSAEDIAAATQKVIAELDPWYGYGGVTP